MEGRASRLVAVLGCLLHLLCTRAVFSQSDNVDTLQPILRTSPPSDMTENGFFGYSIVLHQIADSGDNMATALANTRIIVSAPNASIGSANLKNTGAIYSCPVNPGECSGVVGNMQGADRRLYDMEGNTVSGENKVGQFLGSSMFSNGGRFVACANHYVRSSGAFITPIGRCFYTANRNLEGFTIIDPCPLGNDEFSIGGGGICQAGTSSVITDNGNLGLGAPGYFRWRGLVIRRTPSGDVRRPGFGQGTELNAYQGYAVTSGYFLEDNREDFAVSVPRRMNYIGSVNIVANTNSLTVVSPGALTGTQIGEYYGYTVLGAHLTSTRYSDLLVGAPMHSISTTEPETGRVYIYTNNGGSLQFLRSIDGFETYSRFGYAMANMGDINGDGLDDIAIGAPFAGSGTVYIYHSSTSQVLTINFQQRIIGSELSLMSSVLEPEGFGCSLASGVDVDGNTYNDLAIGSLMSQQVFLLRTRPVATAELSLTAFPRIVNLMNLTCTNRNGQNVACFSIEACVTYSGVSVSSNLTLNLTINADTANSERRIVFMGDEMTSLTEQRSVNIGVRDCITRTVYVRPNTLDRLSAYVFESFVEANFAGIDAQDGNQTLIDLASNPIVSATGVNTVQVETFRDCGGDECTPDLRLSIQNSGQVITLGEGGVEIVAEVMNRGEDSYQSTMTISIPSGRLMLGRVSGSLNSGSRSTLSCPTSMNDGAGMTLVTCNIGNPLPGDAVHRVFVAIMPSPSLIGDEGDLDIGFRLDSIGTVGDITGMASVTIRAEADVMIDPIGTVVPELVTYSNFLSNEAITNATQLGPPVVVSFVVRNRGPSIIRTISLEIDWPSRASDSGENYVIYPALISTAGTSSTVTCMNDNLNPANLDLSGIEEDQQEGQGGGSSGGKKRKRRRRGAVFVPKVKRRNRLAKRQAMSGDDNDDLDLTVDRNFSCGGEDSPLLCVPITCQITGLQGSSGDQARVDITGFIDHRYFANSNDRFYISPTARVSIVDGDFLQGTSSDGKTANATIPIFPPDIRTAESRQIAWWVIFLAILAALIILGVIVGVLWGLGFFKRRKHEELKQKREELQNLEKNAQGPAMSTGSKENITEGSNL